MTKAGRLLRGVAGMDMAEIAEVPGCGTGTAEQLLVRARQFAGLSGPRLSIGLGGKAEDWLPPFRAEFGPRQ